MASTLTPTAWRRWLALELRRLREEAGLSQKEVAKALRCNVSKVSYIENAQRPVVPRDLDEVLLPLYNVPEEQWERYLNAARDARKPRWWESYSEKGALSTAGDLYLGLEQGASRQRVYEPQLVSGLLQVADYTRAMVRRTHAWDDAQTEAVVELRLRRQEALTRSDEPLALWAIVDEASLRRVVGGRETMRAQMTHLAEMARLSNVTLQLLPFQAGAHPAMAGGFKILEFSWPDATDPGVVYLEHVMPPGQFVEDRHDVAGFVSVFEHLCAQGSSPDVTVRELVRTAKEYA